MKRVLLLSTLIALLFSSCMPDQTVDAKVVDSEVEGLEYQCMGMIDYTDKNGTLKCNHTPLALLIGNIKLGVIYEIPQDSIITPQDIAGVSRKEIENKDVIKILTILQSLDIDSNPENGITITKDIREKLSNLPIIDIKKESLTQIKELIESQVEDINFTTPKASLLHLKRSMKKFNIKF